jgi:hypothetical protein
MTKNFSKVNKQRKTKRNRNKVKNKTRVLYRGGEDKKFMLLHEFDTKHLQSFIYFMQYTDSEKTIDSFADFISKANYDNLGGDYVKFEIATNLVSEKTANQMEKCNFGQDGVKFLKLGKMKAEAMVALQKEVEDMEGYEAEEDMEGYEAEDIEGHKIATLLSDKYRGNRIENLFDKPKPKSS